MKVWRMFFVLKVYWLSCNNSCAESSSPFGQAKNWFLKRRLDISLCQVLIDAKYTTDWQLGSNKNLQDSVVKPIIFTTQKMNFSVYGCWNVANIGIFIICFIFMSYEVLFLLCMSYLCYVFYYIFITYLYVLYMFLNLFYISIFTLFDL